MHHIHRGADADFAAHHVEALPRAVVGSAVSHAQAGEGWILRKYLVKKGRKEADLAACFGRKIGWPLLRYVAMFGTHICAYRLCSSVMTTLKSTYSATRLRRRACIYMRLNMRTKDFVTMPSDIVDTFVEE